jgi:hypothetical protein
MTRLSDAALRRAAWVTPLLLVAMVVVGLLLSFVEAPASRHGIGWDDTGSRSDAAFASIISVFPVVGLLILRQQPRNTIGWILQAIGLAWGFGALADNYVRYALLVDPGSLPAPDVVAAVAEGVWVPGIGLMGTFLLLLYPDGRLPSRRWRKLAWLAAATLPTAYLAVTLQPRSLSAPVPLDNPLGVESARRVIDILLIGSVAVLPVCTVASAAAVVARFRRSRGTERLQLKWLATASGVVAALFLLAMVATFASLSGVPPDGGGAARAAWQGWLENVAVSSFVLLPVSIGVAILRHRLYDIDVVINRALVYGALIAALAGVYLGSVLVLQLVLRPVTSRSDLAVAASTLAVAALFRPARARIQAVVDRRFFRQRYDAGLTLDAFATRLRHELDLESVGADLRSVVHDTVAPVHVSLWLRS